LQLREDVLWNRGDVPIVPGETKPKDPASQQIKLDQFLKWVGAVQTGGEAKMMIQAGAVLVNGAVETRRGRKLIPGDTVEIDGKIYRVEL
jgi:ribosome-associated protein